jgi:hypothetical protein
MSIGSKYEYFRAIYDRYHSASKKDKKIILDEFCKNCNYNRKYAIRLLNSPLETKSKKNLSRRGRKKIYDDAIIEIVLTNIWVATNLPCSKRLKHLIPLWLPFYKKQKISQQIKQKLLKISAATIDRIMAPSRAKFSKKGLATTKPGSVLKKQIPIKTDQWDEQQPGFLEADTVAHCGSSVAGMFVYTVNCVDIATQWTEQRAIWGKGETGVLNAISDIESHLPFPVRGFDSDNGSEFLNWHLVRHFQQRNQPAQFTRSRPYNKNDNAHIENKNWTHIRQYLGYQRFDNPELVDMLNDLYCNEWNLYFNFFNNSFKLIEKIRIKSKIIKKFDVPKTPFQRIMESEFITAETKQQLQRIKDSLDPFELQQQMVRKIKAIIKKANNGAI